MNTFLTQLPINALIKTADLVCNTKYMYTYLDKDQQIYSTTDDEASFISKLTLLKRYRNFLINIKRRSSTV